MSERNGGASATKKGGARRQRLPPSIEGLPRILTWYEDHRPQDHVNVVIGLQRSNNPRQRALVTHMATVVSHLQSGRVIGGIEEDQTCAICGELVGKKFLTNMFSVWPESAAHYVTAHGVWTNEHVWLSQVIMGDLDPRSIAPPRVTRTFVPFQTVSGTPLDVRDENLHDDDEHGRVSAPSVASHSRDAAPRSAAPSEAAIVKVVTQMCQTITKAHRLGVLSDVMTGVMNGLSQEVLTNMLASMGLEED